jgi:hypothetical protein
MVRIFLTLLRSRFSPPTPQLHTVTSGYSGELEYDRIEYAVRPGQHMLTYRAEPGNDSAKALDALRSRS